MGCRLGALAKVSCVPFETGGFFIVSGRMVQKSYVPRPEVAL